MHRHHALLCLVLLAATSSASGGLHCSLESYEPLPSAWRGFLTDLRSLRAVGLPRSSQTPPSLLRQEYAAQVQRLQEKSSKGGLSPDEAADLGALLIRLNQPDAAVRVLREAAQQQPRHFAIHSNLGTAWQVVGDLQQAVDHLILAAKLAPMGQKAVEELHLRLVRSRLRRGSASGLDDLFDVRFTDGDGNHLVGRLTPQDRAKLPANGVALAQQLALWFPNDGRLLWQLGELAACHGDLAGAAGLLDLCVGEYGMADPALRKARQAVRAALDARGLAPIGQASQQQAHAGHGGPSLTFKSRRPLVHQPLNARRLPAIKKGQTHLVIWPLLAETATDPRRFKPTYHPYLQKLEGERITLIGFMQPLTDDLECTSFLLVENPVGCWYCEMPDMTGIVFVTVPPGATAKFTRNVIKVTGVLKLNTSDPEDFLFSITDAKVSAPD